MDRIINIKVGGNRLTKDCNKAGTRGEVNITTLRITFDKGWDGYSRVIVFWDAHGMNPTRISLLENEVTTNVFEVKIPPEAMGLAGELTFTIEGYKDGTRQISVSDTLEVDDALIDRTVPVEPTPDQITQLNNQYEGLRNDIKEAKTARDESETFASNAEASAKAAEETKKYVVTYAEGTLSTMTTYLNNTKTYANRAGSLSSDALEAADVAKEFAEKAENAVGKTSYIGDNGNWYAWDSTKGAFYDTGVRAQGDLGMSEEDRAEIEQKLKNIVGYVTNEDYQNQSITITDDDIQNGNTLVTLPFPVLPDGTKVLFELTVDGVTESCVLTLEAGEGSDVVMHGRSMELHFYPMEQEYIYFVYGSELKLDGIYSLYWKEPEKIAGNFYQHLPEGACLLDYEGVYFMKEGMTLSVKSSQTFSAEFNGILMIGQLNDDGTRNVVGVAFGYGGSTVNQMMIGKVLKTGFLEYENFGDVTKYLNEDYHMVTDLNDAILREHIMEEYNKMPTLRAIDSYYGEKIRALPDKSYVNTMSGFQTSEYCQNKYFQWVEIDGPTYIEPSGEKRDLVLPRGTTLLLEITIEDKTEVVRFNNTQSDYDVASGSENGGYDFTVQGYNFSLVPMNNSGLGDTYFYLLVHDEVYGLCLYNFYWKYAELNTNDFVQTSRVMEHDYSYDFDNLSEVERNMIPTAMNAYDIGIYGATTMWEYNITNQGIDATNGAYLKMVSPSGKTFMLSVDDDGKLTTTEA